MEALSHSRTCGDRHVVDEAVRHRVDDHDLLLDRHRLVLRLLQHLDRARAALELALRRRIEVRGERGEGFELAVLREVETETAGDRLHRLDLRRATDARHRDADVDRGTHAGEEQVGLEEDLAVGDRDDVRRDVGRHVAGLRLDDRQRGERAARLEDVLAVDDARILAAASPRARGGASGDRTRRPGYASRPGGRRSTSESWRYAAACFDRSSYTHSVGLPSLYMKYSAIAQPE